MFHKCTIFKPYFLPTIKKKVHLHLHAHVDLDIWIGRINLHVVVAASNAEVVRIESTY